MIWAEALEKKRAIRERDLLLDAVIDSLSDFEEHGLHARECECAYCTGIVRLRHAYEKATGQR